MTQSEKITLLEAEVLAYRKWFDRYHAFVEKLDSYDAGERTQEWLRDEEAALLQIKTKYDLQLNRKVKKPTFRSSRS